jgi:hypothetical protein
MDIVQLYEDYNIDYATEGHKHCRPGWVNTECPFCTGNPGLHLGYNLASNGFTCWRCGWHPIKETIAVLLHVTQQEAGKLIQQYGGKSVVKHEAIVRIGMKPHILPTNTTSLLTPHKRYLEKRDFDPDKLQKIWGLKGTGPISKLDNIDYKHRIIIPYMWNGQRVSFDSRDITDKAQNKYMACSEEREIISHKDILYGRQDAWTDVGIGVEGPTDVWRLGTHAVATSGIKFKSTQVRMIARAFKRFSVLFDGPSNTSQEAEALKKADELVAELRFRGVDAVRIDIEGDPGCMKQSEADYLVKQLIK